MKNQLNIFTDNKIKNFLSSFLSQYELIFFELDNIEYSTQVTQANIIILKNNKDAKLINFQNLNENYLIISTLEKNKLESIKKIKLLNTPVSIENIKNTIENFVQNLTIHFNDISISREKVINISNDLYCYLTKIEIDILTCLIRKKETSKNYIRENILKIKSNIETNSLESHLTRIRKKLNKIKSKVKIQTKSDKLLILF